MFFHFTPPHPAFLSPVIDNAYVFVGFFFLISGFVLAYNYADRPVLSKRSFYLARFSRVYPVYLLVLILSTVPFLKLEWGAHTHADFYRGLILTPLALQSWHPMLATFWNTVAWTVPAELMLYALFPYVLLLLRRHAHRIATPGRLTVAILALWIVGILPHTIYLLTNPDHLQAPATRFTYAFWLRVLKYTPPSYLCTFTAGVLLARLHAAMPVEPMRRALIALLSLAGLTLFFAFAVERVPYVLVHGSLLLPLFSVLLLGLAGANPVSALFAWRPLVLFGETTFSLYLIHFNAILLIQYFQLPARLHIERFDPWITFAFVMLLAFAVVHLYERPARKFVLKHLGPAPS